MCFWTEKSWHYSWLLWAPIWSKERKHSCSVPGFESLQLCQLMMLILIWFKQEYHLSKIYTTYTNGGDRFHLADTPLKPKLVGNICYMTYRYSVLYFLNLSLKHFFPQKTAIFVKISKSETVLVLCSRMPNRRTSQSKIEDIVITMCISLLN